MGIAGIPWGWNKTVWYSRGSVALTLVGHTDVYFLFSSFLICFLHFSRNKSHNSDDTSEFPWPPIKFRDFPGQWERCFSSLSTQTADRQRSFTASGSTTWNSLLAALWSLKSFRWASKTYLFSMLGSTKAFTWFLCQIYITWFTNLLT